MQKKPRLRLMLLKFLLGKNTAIRISQGRFWLNEEIVPGLEMIQQLSSLKTTSP